MNSNVTQEEPWVIRSDFSDNVEWEAICAKIKEPVCNDDEEFIAYVKFVNSPRYEGCSKKEICEQLPSNYNFYFLFIIDHLTVSHPESPVLVVDLEDEMLAEFRSTPEQIQGIENNLSIANMDFAEFAGSVNEDGVFRGFSCG